MSRGFSRRFLRHGLLLCTSAVGTGFLGHYLLEVSSSSRCTCVAHAFAVQKNKLKAAEPALHRPAVWLDDFPSREAQIDAMAKEPEYDIVVIGGGATGCGVAVDAASRGKSRLC